MIKKNTVCHKYIIKHSRRKVIEDTFTFAGTVVFTNLCKKRSREKVSGKTPGNRIIGKKFKVVLGQKNSSIYLLLLQII